MSRDFRYNEAGLPVFKIKIKRRDFRSKKAGLPATKGRGDLSLSLHTNEIDMAFVSLLEVNGITLDQSKLLPTIPDGILGENMCV